MTDIEKSRLCEKYLLKQFGVASVFINTGLVLIMGIITVYKNPSFSTAFDYVLNILFGINLGMAIMTYFQEMQIRAREALTVKEILEEMKKDEKQ